MAEKIETGGSAFPMQDPVAIHAYATARIAHMGGEPDEERERAYVAARSEALGGMTLRDYFAAKAMQAHITASFQALAAQYANYPDVITRTIAKAAYETADAMLKARGQQ